MLRTTTTKLARGMMIRDKKRIKDKEQPVQLTPNVLVFLTRGGREKRGA